MLSALGGLPDWFCTYWVTRTSANQTVSQLAAWVQRLVTRSLAFLVPSNHVLWNTFVLLLVKRAQHKVSTLRTRSLIHVGKRNELGIEVKSTRTSLRYPRFNKCIKIVCLQQFQSLLTRKQTNSVVVDFWQTNNKIRSLSQELSVIISSSRQQPQWHKKWTEKKNLIEKQTRKQLAT